MSKLREVVGTDTFMRNIQPLLLSGLRKTPFERHPAACAAVLVEMAEDLGWLITLQQTALPIIWSLGEDLTVYAIDAAAGIAKRLGEQFTVRHILPPLQALLLSSIPATSQNSRLSFATTLSAAEATAHAGRKSDGRRTDARSIAIRDGLVLLHRLASHLPPELVLSEVLQEPKNVFIKFLLHPSLGFSLLQLAAHALVECCENVGLEATTVIVLPQLKQFFESPSWDSYPLPLDGEGSTDAVGFWTVSGPSSSRFRSSSDHQLPVDSGNSEETTKKARSSTPAVMPAAPNTNEPEDNDKRGSREQSDMLPSVEQHTDPRKFSVKVLSTGREQFADDRRRANDQHVGFVTLVYILYPRLAAIVGIEALHWFVTTWPVLEQSLRKHFAWEWCGESSDNGGKGEASEAEPMARINATTREGGILGPAAAHLLLNGFGWSVPQAGGKRGWPFVTMKPVSRSSGDKRDRETKVGADENEAEGSNSNASSGSQVSPWQWLPSRRSDQEGFGSPSGTHRSSPISGHKRPWRLNGSVLQTWKAHSGRLHALVAGEEEQILLTAGHGDHGAEAARVWSLATKECVAEYLGHTEAVKGLFIWPGSDLIASCDGSLHLWRMGTGASAAIFKEPARSGALHLAVGNFEDGDAGGGISGGSVGAASTSMGPFREHYLLSCSMDRSLALWDLRRGTPALVQSYKGHADGIADISCGGDFVLSTSGGKVGFNYMNPDNLQDGQQKVVGLKLFNSRTGHKEPSNALFIQVLNYSQVFIIGCEDGCLKICD
ncbi:hypothetical protein CBR_g49232 [Chara braunii]|uniref:Uncharacterized protein n=1 Tax=Chara braunii TaxID=69332 RepID=A0A388M4P2_CHABU|nr:hypothetical protein CBR_g49232 [Chara braunii]|eukprot:GBG89442.1 hypothetical protein CBR_g49232 [Chara braunii]